VLELLPYTGGLVLGLHFAGIQSAAWAWSGRAAADAVLLFWAARKLAQGAAPVDWRQLAGGGMLAAAACVASLTVFHVPSLRVVVGGALTVASFARAWRIAPAQARVLFLRPADRQCAPLEPTTTGSSLQWGNDPMLRPDSLRSLRYAVKRGFIISRPA
jgi:hypothetical protein